jgi:2-polyprenyl-3-methyl-5-hydroxy-6-metoxy-1,4-benzoquinol methylase
LSTEDRPRYSLHLSTQRDRLVGRSAAANNVELAYTPTNASHSADLQGRLGPAGSARIRVMTAQTKRWNHHLHYHPLTLNAVPEGCQRALDVGCGEGILARQLHQIIPHVSAIDLHEPSIRLARQQDAAAGIDYLVGDFLTYPFEPASFDLIASVAALHHMDARLALARMSHLLRPGGRLAVVGLARSRYPADLPRDAAAAVAHRLHKATKGYWEISAPTLWPPPETYAGMRRLATERLPRVRYRHHLLWRYSLVWTKPTL